MNESLVVLAGTELALGDYFDDYERRFWTVDGSGCWKIERQQEFIEPGFDSWEAFERGDRARSGELLRQLRPGLVEHFGRIARQGFEFRRVRVVEEPFSPYLVWELNGLLLRRECGEKIRVVTREQVERFERDGVLPEIVTLGTETVFQVLYGEDGAARGAVRSVDHDVVDHWRKTAQELYEIGEELDVFFARNVARLRLTGSA